MSGETKMEQLERKLDDHILEYELFKKKSAEIHERQDTAFNKNMEAISALTAATTDVVKAWEVANGLQKFLKWLSGFAILGGSVMWLISQLPDSFFS